MQLFVKTLSGKTTTVEVEAGQTIAYIKEKLRETEGIPVKEQRLTFSGKNLDDNRTIGYYDMINWSSVSLLLRLKGGMQIYVNTLSGGSTQITINETDTILNLKEKVKEIEGYPESHQILVFGGKVLENYKTLNDCNIKENSIVHKIIRCLCCSQSI